MPNIVLTAFPYILASTLIIGLTIAHHAQTGQTLGPVDYIRVAVLTYVGGVLFNEIGGFTEEEGNFYQKNV